MRRMFLVAVVAAATNLLGTLVPCAAARDATAEIPVLIWDEQQPAQKKAYEHFIGDTLAEYLRSKGGFNVTSVNLNQPEQGLGGDVLDHCKVLIWWGHVRNREVPFETGKRISERIKAGKLSMITLHSAHWSSPFVEAMWERTALDAINGIPEEKRKDARITYVLPKLYVVPKREAPLTPSIESKTGADGNVEVVVRLPDCVFPAYRADGKPSQVKTLLPGHPIAAGVPAEFEIPQTEMYDEPFHVPAPDAVIFEEHFSRGEHFRSGCLWNVGRGKVFYFRPGHEIYPVYKQEIPLRIIENATRWLAAQLPPESDAPAK